MSVTAPQHATGIADLDTSLVVDMPLSIGRLDLAADQNLENFLL
jgi:hypothetical protein